MSSSASPSMGRPDRNNRKADRRVGSIVLGVAFAVSLLINIAAKRYADAGAPEPPAPPSPEGLEGWPKRVDPIRALAVARARTERQLLRGIVARNVREDGTVDLTLPGSAVRYAFDSPAEASSGASRKPGDTRKREHCGRQSVELGSEGMGASLDVPSGKCATKKHDPLPEPHCSLAQIWKSALKHGAKTDALARIEYFSAKAGPAWRFVQPSGFSAVFGRDCSRELKGADARGQVPKGFDWDFEP